MQTVTYTSARKNFKSTMQQVVDDHTPIIITRQSEAPVVMMSLEDYNSIEETLYLLRSPKNATRLKQAIEDVEKKKYTSKNLLEK